MLSFSIPERCVVVNLATAQRLTCQHNPERITERIGNVDYARRDAIGSSWQWMHYRSTPNRQVILEFYMNRIGTGYDIMGFRRFMLNLTRASSVTSRLGPPPMMLIWPNRLSVTGRIVDLQFEDDQFASDGSVLSSTARCTIEVDERATRAGEGG